VGCAPSGGAPLPEKAKGPKVYALVYVGSFRGQRNTYDELMANEMRNWKLCGYFNLKEIQQCHKEKAFDFLGAKKDTESKIWLRKHIKVESLGGTTVFRISIDDAPFKSRTIILNAILDGYQRELDELKKGPGNPCVIERATVAY
jgi:hypothetical protein